MNTGRFGRPQDRAQVVGIFNSVKEYQKGWLPSDHCLLKNLFGCIVGFRGDERDHALVVSARHQSIEGRRRFYVDGDPLCLGEMEKVRKLSISSQHEQPLKRPRAGAQSLTHGVQTIDQFWLTIASTGLCRQAYLR